MTAAYATKTKIKIFNNFSTPDLEKAVNEWMAEQKPTTMIQAINTDMAIGQNVHKRILITYTTK